MTLEEARKIVGNANPVTGEGVRLRFSSAEDQNRYFEALNMVEEADYETSSMDDDDDDKEPSNFWNYRV